MESTEGPQNSVSKQPSKWAFPPWHCSGFTGDSLGFNCLCLEPQSTLSCGFSSHRVWRHSFVFTLGYRVSFHPSSLLCLVFLRNPAGIHLKLSSEQPLLLPVMVHRGFSAWRLVRQWPLPERPRERKEKALACGRKAGISFVSPKNTASATHTVHAIPQSSWTGSEL